MFDKVQTLRRRYGNERTVLDISSAVARLMTLALKVLRQSFDNLDAQTSEILGALRNYESQRKFLQDSRDDLYCRLLAWDDVLDRWNKASTERGPDKPILLREAYQFLAPRFMPSEQWTLAGQLSLSKLESDGQRSIPNAMKW